MISFSGTLRIEMKDDSVAAHMCWQLRTWQNDECMGKYHHGRWWWKPDGTPSVASNKQPNKLQLKQEDILYSRKYPRGLIHLAVQWCHPGPGVFHILLSQSQPLALVLSFPQGSLDSYHRSWHQIYHTASKKRRVLSPWKSQLGRRKKLRVPNAMFLFVF